MSKFTKEQMNELRVKSHGGVMPRYNGAWYLHRKLGKLSDFGGKREGNETLMETALREFKEESGLTEDNITHIHGVYIGRYNYGVIVVEVDKEPVAMEPGSTIVRMENYSTADVSGRLFIKGLEYKMRDIEMAEVASDEDTTPDNHGFIFDD